MQRRTGWMIGMMAAAAAVCQPALAQSETCSGAMVISTGTYTGTTLGRTPNGSSNCSGVSPAAWYAFTAPASGVLSMSTCGSAFDTVLSLHTGCPGNSGNELVCNDDSCGLQSELVSGVVGGRTYWIRVGGFGGAAGPYTLTVGFTQTEFRATCVDALAIGPGTYVGMTSGQSPSGATTCGNSDNSPAVWYAFTAPSSGQLLLNTCGSEFDTVLSLHSGCPGHAQTTLACNDDTPACGAQSALTRQVSGGTTYRIRVSGFGGASGVYRLNVAFRPDQNNTCQFGPGLTDGTHYGSSVGATNDGSAMCGVSAASGDVWYTYTAPISGDLTISMCDSQYDTVLSVHSECPGVDVTQIACNDDACGNSSRLTLPVSGGSTYVIRVAGYSGATGPYVLSLNMGPRTADTCASAPPIGNGVYTGSTVGAAASGGTTCGQSTGPAVWYAYTAPASGQLTLATCGSGFDTVLSVHSGCAGNTQIACNDDACGFGSRVTIPVVAGSTYYVRVSGYKHDAGNYTLAVSLATCPADVNNDGAINSSDISAFITLWLGSVQNNNLAADFNGDGAVNSSDISAFITAWLAAVQHGC